jgi:TolB-like protein
VQPGNVYALLRITLVGRMEVRDREGRSFLPRNRKTRALLAILALAAPRPVLRRTLTERLWSQRASEQARGSLRQCIHELQNLLHPLGGTLLKADRHHLSLHREAIWLDTAESIAEPEHLLEDLAGLDPIFDSWLDTERRRIAHMRAPDVPAPPPPVGTSRVRVRVGIPPFRSLDGAAEDPLSLGLADEITTALSRFRWMFIVASPSLAALAGGAREFDRGWPALDLDFMLDGTVQRSRDRIRVMVRLLDMRAGGEVVWAERFDHEHMDCLTLQDDIAAKTAAQLDPVLMQREAVRAASRPANSLTAYDLVLRSVPAIYRLEEVSFRAAGAALAEAVTLNPDYAAAHVWLTWWHVFLLEQGWASDPATAIARAGELAERATLLDPSDARGFTIAGHVRAYLYRETNAAIELHARALALNPNLPLAWALSGLAFTYAGQYDEAIRRISRARALSLFDPQSGFFDMALMIPHLQRGEYETVVELGRQAQALNPSLTATYKVALAALGHLGRLKEAAVVRAKLLQLDSRFSVREALARSPMPPEDNAIYAQGLRLSGLPEQAPQLS